MRNITAAFKAHLQGGVTTVCTCITITRRDKASFGMTDHDEKVTVDGRDYVPFNSFARSSISSTSSLEVDQMEINGILNSDAFAREEIGSGLFDFAEVNVFLVNYMDPTMGTMSLRRGWIGEIEMNEDGSFHAEIRGLSQIFTYRVGEPYAPECAADLGDIRCKIGLNPDWWQPANIYRQGDTVLGHIAVPSGYVNAASTNADFSDETDPSNASLATGWVSYGDIGNGQWHFSSNWHGLVVPPTGGLMAGVTDVFGTNVCQGLGMYQDIDLVASGLTTTDIDLGDCRVSFKGFVGLTSGNSKAQLRLYAIDDQGVVHSIWDSGLKAYAQDRWITLSTNDTLIPAGARKVRVDFFGTKRATEGFGATFGGYTMQFNDPSGTYNSAGLSNSVMFQAQNAGVSGDSEPAFSDALASTVVDNGITWKTITSFKDVSTVTSLATANLSFHTTLPHGDEYYDGGLILWETGKNAGRAMQIKTWAGGVLTLFQHTFFAFAVGDRFVIHPGCDKRRATCISKFSNLLNFRGFPDVPGQDAYMQTPNQPAQ
jgi:hypothetical protein